MKKTLDTLNNWLEAIGALAIDLFYNICNFRICQKL